MFLSSEQELEKTAHGKQRELKEMQKCWKCATGQTASVAKEDSGFS